MYVLKESDIFYLVAIGLDICGCTGLEIFCWNGLVPYCCIGLAPYCCTGLAICGDVIEEACTGDPNILGCVCVGNNCPG